MTSTSYLRAIPRNAPCRSSPARGRTCRRFAGEDLVGDLEGLLHPGVQLLHAVGVEVAAQPGSGCGPSPGSPAGPRAAREVALEAVALLGGDLVGRPRARWRGGRSRSRRRRSRPAARPRSRSSPSDRSRRGSRCRSGHPLGITLAVGPPRIVERQVLVQRLLGRGQAVSSSARLARAGVQSGRLTGAFHLLAPRWPRTRRGARGGCRRRCRGRR